MCTVVSYFNKVDMKIDERMMDPNMPDDGKGEDLKLI